MSLICDMVHVVIFEAALLAWQSIPRSGLSAVAHFSQKARKLCSAWLIYDTLLV